MAAWSATSVSDCVRYVEKRLATCPNPDPLGNRISC